MASITKSTRKKSPSEHAFFGHTLDLLSEVWDHWVTHLGHSPATAKKKMTAHIKEFHKSETQEVKKKPSGRPKTAKRASAKKRHA